MLEKIQEKNKRACTFIREVRVYAIYNTMEESFLMLLLGLFSHVNSPFKKNIYFGQKENICEIKKMIKARTQKIRPLCGYTVHTYLLQRFKRAITLS